MSSKNNAINMSQISTVKIQVITATGSSTYTPSTGMVFCTVELVGGGGGGGGGNASAGQGSAGSGGAGGGYCRKTYTSALIGANAAVVVGAGGAGGVAGANDGVDGTSSTFTPAGAGVVLTAGGGTRGHGIAKSASINVTGTFGGGGTGTNGDLNITGGSGGNGVCLATATLACGGYGGTTPLSETNFYQWNPSDNNGAAGKLYGGGGNGAGATASDQAGGDGAQGVCYITEYCNQ